MLSNPIQILKVFKNSKTSLQSLPLYRNLSDNTRFNKKSLNLNFKKSYNIININFYDTYTQWYNKRLAIIGKHASEYSLDLKPTSTLTPKQVVNSENIKLEFKNKYKRKGY
jgi:hypothetical protein